MILRSRVLICTDCIYATSRRISRRVLRHRTEEGYVRRMDICARYHTSWSRLFKCQLFLSTDADQATEHLQDHQRRGHVAEQGLQPRGKTKQQTHVDRRHCSRPFSITCDRIPRCFRLLHNTIINTGKKRRNPAFRKKALAHLSPSSSRYREVGGHHQHSHGYLAASCSLFAFNRTRPLIEILTGMPSISAHPLPPDKSCLLKVLKLPHELNRRIVRRSAVWREARRLLCLLEQAHRRHGTHSTLSKLPIILEVKVTVRSMAFFVTNWSNVLVSAASLFPCRPEKAYALCFLRRFVCGDIKTSTCDCNEGLQLRVLYYYACYCTVCLCCCPQSS